MRYKYGTMEGLLQIAAQLTKATTMAHRSLRLVFDSQEALSDEQIARLVSLHDKVGHLCFLPEERKIGTLDVLALPPLQFEKDEKSQSQRLRGVLYILWQQKGEEGAFIDFYQRSMEKIIDSVKERLT